jgi:hypothetical protein
MKGSQRMAVEFKRFCAAGEFEKRTAMVTAPKHGDLLQSNQESK